MIPSRQIQRRSRFATVFAQMPLWEVWKTDDGKTSATYEYDKTEKRLKLVGVGTVRHHCKSIPRRLRRTMARERSQREWRESRGR